MSYLASKKSKQDYVGLSNQGATCYMNSLLQTLFMTPEFRIQLYKWQFNPNKHGDPEDCIPYQLSLLFSKLQISDSEYVETTGLTKSFQWDMRESFQQHDVQEFCRVLFDAIEQSVEGTSQANVINELYQGTFIDYVKCLKCGQESCREDKFLDISLPVRNDFDKIYNKSVEMALSGYVKYEELSGENKYFCEKCRCKNDAIKGLKFKSLPKILALQLKRFDLDMNTLQRIKLNDKVTFPEVLNMNPYISQNYLQAVQPTGHRVRQAKHIQDTEIMHISQPYDKRPLTLDSFYKKKLSGDNSFYLKCERNKLAEKYLVEGPNVYELFSILIHSGSALGGHYYAYIKSFENLKWYCFNDSTVTQIQQDDIQKVYGGNSSSFNSSYSSNAYLLMYRRIDSENLQKVEKSLIPDYLLEQIEVDKHKKKQEQLEKEEKGKILRIKVVCKTSEKYMEVKKDLTIKEFTEQVVKEFGLQEHLENIRIRGYSSYYETFQETFEDDKNLDESGIYTNKVLAVETKKPNQVFLPYDPQKYMLKLHILPDNEENFETATADPQQLHIDKKETIKTLMEMIQKEFKVPIEKQMIVKKSYNSVPEYVTSSSLINQTLSYARIFDGTTLYVEANKDGKSKWMKILEREQGKLTLRFNNPLESEDSQEPFKYSLSLDRDMTVEDLRKEISSKLSISQDSFIIKKYSSYGNELKDLTTKLSQLNFYTNTTIFVEQGVPTKPDEIRVQFQLALNPRSRDSDGTIFALDNLIDMPIRQSIKVSEIKEILCQELLLRYPTMQVQPEYLRFRFNSHLVMGKVLMNKECLADHKFTDKVFICVQILNSVEKALDNNDILVYVKVWFPNTWELSNTYEIVINKNYKLHDLGTSISNQVGIEVNCI